MLPLLPGAGFESSLLTAVLVGMLILLFFNESWGWAFTGIVVPGYLASVFLVRPAAGLIVSAEALVTFALVAGYTRIAARYGRLSPLFGRERFFALLVCSIALRIGMESWLLPWISQVTADLGRPIDDGTGLYGVGLVIVPLAANVLWTGGFVRGGWQLGVTVTLTYLLLSLVIVPHTNLAISDFELSFEDVATSFAASPKAYILLVVTCYLATAAVRWFSWDVGGTLVPGLMAVAWLTPAKLVALFAEVAMVLLIAEPLRRWGVLRGASASRRLASAFALLYLGKLTVALITDLRFPGLRVTDLFGLGYVLPAVLVERIWTHGHFLRVMAPATLLSALGALVGIGLGLGLTRIVPAALPAVHTDAQVSETDRDLRAGILAGAVRVARTTPSMTAPVVGPLELTAYRSLLLAARRKELLHAARAGASLGVRIEHWPKARTVAIYEDPSTSAGTRGFGTVILRFASGAQLRAGPVIVVPFPWDESWAAAAAAPLAEQLDAGAVLTGGVARGSQRGDPMARASGPSALALAVLAPGRTVVELREGGTAFEVKGSLPSELLELLRDHGLFGIEDELSTRAAASRRETGILRLPRADLQRIIAQADPEPEPIELSRVGERAAQLTRADSHPSHDPYAPLEFVRGALLPAIDALWLTDDGEQSAWAASLAAQAAGFDLRAVVDSAGTSTDLVVLESTRVPVVALLRRASEAFSRAPASRQTLFVLSPRADSEPGTLELSLKLFERLSADLLLVSARRAESFLLAARALADEEPLAEQTSCASLVVRGFSQMRPLSAKMLWTPGSLTLGDDATPVWQQHILQRLATASIDLKQVGSGAEHAFALPRGGWRMASQNGRVIHLWASASLRQEARHALRPHKLRVAGWLAPWPSTVPALAAKAPARARSHPSEELARLSARVFDFNESQDPAVLQDLSIQAERLAARAVLWQPPAGAGRIDPHVVILLRSTSATYVAMISLAPLFCSGIERASSYEAISDYLQSDKAALELVVTREARP